MRLVTKWLLTSIGGCIVITAGLLALPDSVVDVTAISPIIDKVVEVVFWPMAVCVYLSGPGAPIGPPEKHMYEATPVQIVAAFLGVGVTWFFYSSLGFLIFWLRRRWRAIRRTTPTPDTGNFGTGRGRRRPPPRLDSSVKLDAEPIIRSSADKCPQTSVSTRLPLEKIWSVESTT